MNTLAMASTALFLGMRHGIEWDHVAAIMDIVSSAPVTATQEPMLIQSGWPQRFVSDLKRSKAMQLASLYAVGHAFIVAVLGGIAMIFSVLLPKWIEPIMEKIVGVTLLLFGLYIVYSLCLYCLGKQHFRMQSRWMLLIRAVSRLVSRREDCGHEQPQPGCCGPRSAFGLGLLHGFGAETGTQVLLLSTVSSSGRSDVGSILIGCFIAGMFLSNIVVAAFVSSGAQAARIAAPVNLAIGAITAIFSIWVGFQLITT